MEKPNQSLIDRNRRDFIQKGFLFTVASGTGISLLTGCGEANEKEEQEVSPPEDLMQEHGLLNRILLIYDHCRMQLLAGHDFSREALTNSANIIRTFVEDYHEKQEENYLFPRFRKANQLTSLVDTLLVQHEAGRVLTDKILYFSKSEKLTEIEKQKMIQALASFTTMYRPHETREDTVLCPAFRKLVSRHEYDALGEEFEKNEHKLFGEDGFATTVNKVEAIEKSLGIYELSQFTPLT
jgi:hemerythrin-like domain-containing protein